MLRSHRFAQQPRAHFCDEHNLVPTTVMNNLVTNYRHVGYLVPIAILNNLVLIAVLNNLVPIEVLNLVPIAVLNDLVPIAVLNNLVPTAVMNNLVPTAVMSNLVPIGFFCKLSETQNPTDSRRAEVRRVSVRSARQFWLKIL